MVRLMGMHLIPRPRSWRNYCLDAFLLVMLTSFSVLFFALGIGGS